MKRISKILAFIIIFTSMFSINFQTEAANKKSIAPTIERLGGENRILTSIKVSKKSYSNSENVILIGYNGEVDALSGTLLANKLDAPIIMTNKDKLHPDTKKEIERLKVKNVIILGGESVVSKNVERDLKGYEVERIQGINREETAIKIAKRALGNQIEEVFVSVGYGAYADALAIGPVTAIQNKPLLLLRKDGISKTTLDALDELGVKKLTIIGGQNAVSKNTENTLRNKNISVNRIFGNNREETSIKIAENYIPNPNKIIMANGYVYADSVVGGYFAVKENAPIILTRSNRLIYATHEYISKNKVDTKILGLNTAINKEAEKDIAVALGLHSKTLIPGNHIVGKHIKEGVYDVTFKGSGNFFVYDSQGDLVINEIGTDDPENYDYYISKCRVILPKNGNIELSGVSAVFTPARRNLIPLKQFELYTGMWETEKDVTAGVYDVTFKGSGNFFVYDRDGYPIINEIGTNDPDDYEYYITKYRAHIPKKSLITLSGVDAIFTPAKASLKPYKEFETYSGLWAVGKDITAGRYKIKLVEGSGNFIVYGTDGWSKVNEVLGKNYGVTEIVINLKNKDIIDISGINKVKFIPAK